MEDAALLHRYALEQSEDAFAELVRRHVDLVYASALRQLHGDHHRAQEVTQMVFVTLARKAATLARHPALPAWLYRCTSFVAADLRRREGRRSIHERAVAEEADLIAEEIVPIDWSRTRTALDEVMNQLGERDREAIVLRFFASRPFGEIGSKLGLSENAARMRVERALEKLRERLNRRGITSTCAALAAGLSTEAALAAPAGVATAAAAAGVAASASGSAGLLLFMSANKITVGVIGLLVAAGVGIVAVQNHANAQFASRLAGLQSQADAFGPLRKENQALSRELDGARILTDAIRGQDAVAARLRAVQAENAALRRSVAAEAARRRAAGSMNGNSSLGSNDIAALHQIPTPILQPRPVYPASMRAQHIGGQVMVDLIVDPAGNVQNAHAASSSQPEFEQSAIAAVSQWQFSPGQFGARTVNTQVQVPVVFSIGDQAAEVPSTPVNSVSPADWFSGASEGKVVLETFYVQTD